MAQHLTLRQVRESDRWILWEWRNTERIRRVSAHDENIPRADHDAWFSKNFTRMHDRTIILEIDGSPVGWYQIEQWDSETRSGEWGIALGETDVPVGLGGALPLLALSHAFDRLEATQMTGRVLQLNKGMVSIMRRLQILIVETSEEQLRREGGECTSMIVYQIERSDWCDTLQQGRMLVPAATRALLDRAMSEPIHD